MSRGMVVLSETQRVAARDLSAWHLRAARASVRDARGWRLMPAAVAAGRYVDQRAEARARLELAASERRLAVHYAQLATSGLAPAGSSWDPRSWGIRPDPSIYV